MIVILAIFRRAAATRSVGRARRGIESILNRIEKGQNNTDGGQQITGHFMP